MSCRLRTVVTSKPDGLAEAVIAALLDLNGDIQHHFQLRAAEFAITPIQAHALQHLTPGQPLLMGKLAGRLDCSNSRVTAIVDRLEEAGLVRRQVPAHNRRAIQLMLTAEGERVRSQVWRRMLDCVPATAGLTQNEQRQLARLLAKALRAHRGAAHLPNAR